MTYPTRRTVLSAITGLTCLSHLAIAQTVPTTQAQPPVTSPSVPGAAPTPAATTTLPPPGYVLVPAGSVAYPAAKPQEEANEPKQEMAYSTNQPIPDGYHVEERVRKGLVIGGSLTLGVPWVFSATAAVGNDFEDKTGFLVIPALGPWLMLAAGGASDDHCANDEYDTGFCKSSHASQRALLFLDGVTQTAGAIMLAVGIAYPTQRLVRNNIAISFAPTPVGRDGYGLGAVGTF